MDQSIWFTLGIAPTEDVGAIRRAYASALKAIDPERDPKSFVALRAAYDAARSGPVGRGEPIAAPSSGEAAAISPLGRRADRAEIARLVRDISDRLHTDIANPAADEMLGDLTLRLLAEVELEVVDRHAELEEWLAATIAATTPRSDAMIRPVQAYFNWHTRQHVQHRPDKASVIVDRWRALNYAEAVLFAPTGRHHRAFLALQAPPRSNLFLSPDMPTLAAVERFFEVHGYRPAIPSVEFDPDILLKWYAELRRNIIARGRLIPTGTPSYRIRPWALCAALALVMMGASYAIAH